MLGLEIVAEAIRRGLHHRETLGVGPVLRGIATTPGERNLDAETGIARRLFHRRRTGQHDCIGHRQTAAQLVDLGQGALKLLGLIDRPAALRLEPDARAVGAAAMV